jgi:acetyltransferase AlgX (SGNH hydrolase-like protein)
MSIGRLLPRVMAALFLIDALSRFIPQDRLCFQAWECVTRFQEPGAIFEANRQFRSTHTHGNMANMGNVPALRQYRPQVFTTDAYGFRNEPSLANGNIDGLVLGDSYVAGYGNSDGDTLPVRLSEQTGLRFYNAGGPYAYLATARLLKTRLTFAGRRAIVVWTENVPLPFFEEAERRAETPDRKSRLLNLVFYGQGERVRSELRGLWFMSPVKIVAEKAYLAISNDKILPNTYAQRASIRRLTTGAPIIFYPPDVEAFERPGEAWPAVDHLTRLAAELSHEGFNPLIVLVPSKYTVYYPMLEGSNPETVDTNPLLARVDRALRTAGISVIDLTPSFQAQAHRDLAAGQYLYWLDDTHWNARGIEFAAGLIRRQLNTTSDGKGSGNHGI